MMKAKSPLRRARRGSDFRGFLKEQGILKEVEAQALKQAVKLTHQTVSHAPVVGERGFPESSHFCRE
jgi:hypothetical protein